MEQPIRTKKIPERQCLGCNAHRPKRELIRVLRAPEGSVSVNYTGRASGRGAYICPCVKCLERAQKSRRLERSLGCAISGEVYAALAAEIEARCDHE